jgi:hypothetical protein
VAIPFEGSQLLCFNNHDKFCSPSVWNCVVHNSADVGVTSGSLADLALDLSFLVGMTKCANAMTLLVGMSQKLTDDILKTV